MIARAMLAVTLVAFPSFVVLSIWHFWTTDNVHGLRVNATMLMIMWAVLVVNVFWSSGQKVRRKVTGRGSR